MTNRIPCPRCGTHAAIDKGAYYGLHTANRGDDHYCPMSKQRIPITGTAEKDWESRAYLVGNLAGQLRDSDPHVVWDYLTGLSALELQHMLMVALTAVDPDQTIREMYQWVWDLPVAKLVAA